MEIIKHADLKLEKNIQKKNATILTSLKKGYVVLYNKWGKGLVFGVNGDIIIVQFYNNSVRRLTLKICNKLGLLQLVST